MALTTNTLSTKISKSTYESKRDATGNNPSFFASSKKETGKKNKSKKIHRYIKKLNLKTKKNKTKQKKLS
jgi:hypothetical protein